MEIKIQVEKVDLASTVGEHYTQVGEEDWRREPQTLGQAIATQVAEDLKRDEGYRTLKRQILDLRDAEIREQLKPIVADAIRDNVQLTNAYGDKLGEPISLKTLIIKEVQEYLTRRDSYSSNLTPIQKIVREEVERTFRRELAEVIADEKMKVVAAVRAKAAEIITEAVKEGIGR